MRTSQKLGKTFSVPPHPPREEAAQARSLDARRIMSIRERRRGSFLGHVVAPLCLDAEWAPHHRERGNRSFILRKTPPEQKNVRRVSRSRWCGALSASRQRGAILSLQGLEMTLADVPRYSRMRRASSERACAASSRDGAPRPLFWVVASEKCVPAHIKR